MMKHNKINPIIANELKIRPEQVAAVMQLLNEGSTIPFIARYRKEATGGLDDSQLRLLESRLHYLSELMDRKYTIITSIRAQDKLTSELEMKINATLIKTELEDLYLPYKLKRRTRGQIAMDAGLTELANSLWDNPDLDPETEAKQYQCDEKGFSDPKMALDGARFILMERFAEDAALLAKIRHYLWYNAHLVSSVLPDKLVLGEKFKDYFDYNELLKKIPSHRALALFRGRNQGILQLRLNANPQSENLSEINHCVHLISEHVHFKHTNKRADAWRESVIHWTWRLKISLHMETALMAILREKAEEEAINVFGNNLNDMLMAAPAGMRVTMGMDPGLRTGVKLAVVDKTGKLLAAETIYPHTNKEESAAATVAELCQHYQVELVAIGNGTASRETERFFLDTVKKYPAITAQKVIVSEAGASVYSASELAAEEFPNLDVSLRGAVSIARRLQDPLAELVKIEPKAIGVGQYQHDVSQLQLAAKLNGVVEDCVNRVGVDLNTASAALLSRIAGLNKLLAQNIIQWRNQNGYFSERKQLLEVNRLGPKSFQQCAGFLRINNGANPLDASAVHPEAYAVVEHILLSTNTALCDLMSNKALLLRLDPKEFIDTNFGLPTVADILKELEKPGRDPRPVFKTAQFVDNIVTMDDLTVGMTMEGIVSNVTNFGAFVDIGVHQDGLVHISLLADKFVDDPRRVVKTGDIVKVSIIGIDKERKRIALSMRQEKEKQPHAVSSKTNIMTKNGVMGAAFSAVLGKVKA